MVKYFVITQLHIIKLKPIIILSTDLGFKRCASCNIFHCKQKYLFSCDFLCFINTSESFLLILTVRSISDAMRDNVLPQKVVTRTSTKLIYIQFLFFLVAISAGYHIFTVCLTTKYQETNKMLNIFRRHAEKELSFSETLQLSNVYHVQCFFYYCIYYSDAVSSIY